MVKWLAHLEATPVVRDALLDAGAFEAYSHAVALLACDLPILERALAAAAKGGTGRER